MMGCVGDPLARTPNLDRLAGEGALFSQAYCQNPLCVPSRASLMTGKYCKNTGVYDNRHIIAGNCMTLPRILSLSGYRTCVIGKTHVNGEQWQGFMQRPYGDLYGQGHQPDPSREHFGENPGLRGIESSGPSGIPLPLTQTEICVAEASKWLQSYMAQPAGQPFFLCVNFDKPHFPVNPPREYFDHYIDEVILNDEDIDYVEGKAVPFVSRSAHRYAFYEHRYNKDIIRKALAAYYGCVEWVDSAVGRIVDVLDYLGLKDDTVVIYSSDHGEMAYNKGFWQKCVLFDDSARIPLIFRCPPRIRRNEIKHGLTGLIDIMPTICDMAGIEINEPVDGISFRAALESGAPSVREEIYCETTVFKEPGHAGCMIRSGEWKYNHYLDGCDELYNMEADPKELDNLAGNAGYTAIANMLRDKVIAFWEPGNFMSRYMGTPMMRTEKHYYPYSNQFVLSDGTIIDARP